MQDKLEILFQDNQGSWHNPIRIKTLDDIENIVNKNKQYYKYIVRQTKDNTQSIVASGIIQDGYKKVRRK